MFLVFHLSLIKIPSDGFLRVIQSISIQNLTDIAKVALVYLFFSTVSFYILV